MLTYKVHHSDIPNFTDIVYKSHTLHTLHYFIVTSHYDEPDTESDISKPEFHKRFHRFRHRRRRRKRHRHRPGFLCFAIQ